MPQIYPISRGNSLVCRLSRSVSLKLNGGLTSPFQSRQTSSASVLLMVCVTLKTPPGDAGYSTAKKKKMLFFRTGTNTFLKVFI